MKKQYDFSKSMPNPYISATLDKTLNATLATTSAQNPALDSAPTTPKKARKKQISINLNVETIEYFKAMANKQGVSYQALMNIFLNQCASKKLEIKI